VNRTCATQLCVVVIRNFAIATTRQSARLIVNLPATASFRIGIITILFAALVLVPSLHKFASTAHF